MSTPIETLRHSLSHVLALAVQRIYGSDVKFGTGPAVENGFYYDLELSTSLTESDLPKIQKVMEKIIQEKIHFQKKTMPWLESFEFFKAKNQPYKLELLDKIVLEKISKDERIKVKEDILVTHFQLGDFEDLCRGPLVKNTQELQKIGFLLEKTAGAYWQGDEKNPMLTRISGLAFKSQKELQKFLSLKEEAKKRDHKKIGRELDLFSFHKEALGSAYWHPKGMIIWNELEKYGKSLRHQNGYQEIQTPQLAKSSLWIKSGHWDHYKDSMFHFDYEKETYCLKPMDCPFNIQIYQTQPKSYKELPVRYTEIGRIIRNEKSGELNGLFRLRALSQDDAHIFLKENQIKQEIITALKMVKNYYKTFDLKPEFYLSTRPDDFLGQQKIWDKAEKNLTEALTEEGIRFQLKEKDGAFYGPKIDVDMRDSLGRKWQLATIQLDFQLPQKFKLEYADKDGKKKTPVMIHAAVFGSIERFIGILTEHLAGNFPFWLSPVQIKIVTVSEKHWKYCQKLQQELLQNNFRVEIDNQNESVGKKIRQAISEKIPYVIVIGDKEIESGNLAVRHRDTGQTININQKEFLRKIQKELPKI